MTAPKRIVVVGRDAPLWLASASIRTALAHGGAEVTAVELPGGAGPSQLLLSLPPLKGLHDRLGLSEADMLTASGGSFSLGHYFRPADSGQPWFHAWSDHGAGIDGHDFFDCWLRASQLGLNVPFADFNPAAVAARHGLMLAPDTDSPWQGRYGYHLRARAYADYLKDRAIGLGVAARSATIVEPEIADDGASLTAISIDHGALILKADLFVDASGGDAILSDALPSPDGDARNSQFPASATLWARAPGVTAHGPYVDFRPSALGWTAMIPVRSGVHVLHLFDREATSNEQALADASAAAGVTLDDVCFGSLASGTRQLAWQGNVVALGEAACAVDPIHAADVHALHLGIAHLLSLLPAGSSCDAERAEYNRIMRSCFDRIRDFQAAFYALSPYVGPFWDRGRAMPLPQSMSHKIDLFQARGAIAPMEDESFAPDSWRAQLLGSGIMPDSWPPSAERIAPDRLQQEVHRLLSSIKATVIKQPRHEHLLAQLSQRQPA